MKGKATRFSILLTALLACITATAATQVIEGEIWSGAKYMLTVPDNWNGDLVVYAHGYIDAREPIALPTVDDIHALRDRLTTNGYAVAYSSYSMNGFAVREGTLATVSLNHLFAKAFERPERTFLIGHSMGGLVSVRLAEALPQHYDGVLSVAGMVGGSQVEVDYMTDVRILYELHYPGVLPGAINDIPADVDLLDDIVIPVATAAQINPDGVGAIVMTDQTPLAGTNGAQWVESLITALGFWYGGFDDLAERTGGPDFFGNEGVEYTSLYLPAEVMAYVNAEVPRFTATRRAGRYFRFNYEPTGRLRVPHLALHNRYDPVVPVFHQALYAEQVAEHGDESLLVQRISQRYGHTAIFSAEEVYAAFTELVEWTDTGEAPTP